MSKKDSNKQNIEVDAESVKIDLNADNVTINGRQITVDQPTPNQPNPPGPTANQGAPNTPANAWPVKVTNGGSTILGSPGNPFPVSGNVKSQQFLSNIFIVFMRIGNQWKNVSL